ncbi:MAG: ABC transporter substrate-binding protein, partial [Simkaniaceae bacterium]|nr:ABC transporter substrate-binding protein [Simkaniaceae bacterium]
MKWLKVMLFLLVTISAYAETTLLLDWWPNANHIPLFSGIEKGYFREEGIDLRIIKSDEAPKTFVNLMSNNADIAIYYLPQTLRHMTKYPDLRIIGTLIKEPLQAFVFRKDRGLSTPQDLDGKILGLAPGGLTERYLEIFQTREGLSFHIKKVLFDLNTALITDWVDVVSGVFWNIEPIQLKHLGIETSIFKLKDFGVPNYPELIFIAREETL